MSFKGFQKRSSVPQGVSSVFQMVSRAFQISQGGYVTFQIVSRCFRAVLEVLGGFEVHFWGFKRHSRGISWV